VPQRVFDARKDKRITKPPAAEDAAEDLGKRWRFFPTYAEF
jgi:hypothetical protein